MVATDNSVPLERVCEECGGAIPEGKRSHAKYCSEKCKSVAGMRRRYAANPEKWREYSRRWHAENNERARENGRRWREKNPEKHREGHRRWAAENPEHYLWSAARNRAKKYEYGFTFEVSDVSIPTRCPYLGIELGPVGQGSRQDNTPTIDRIDNEPRYDGAASGRPNTIVVSWRANRLKRDRTPAQLRATGDPEKTAIADAVEREIAWRAGLDWQRKAA